MAEFVLSLSTRIQADESIPAIENAVKILRRDMRQGLKAEGPENVIRVALDESLGAEHYTAQVRENGITLNCGDDLGAVYALLSVSERLLDVGPFDWWMGFAPRQFDTVAVSCQDWQSPRPAVRWRGWFANDEVLFTGWHLEEAQRAEVWRRLFECLLRCGGNMIIPGTDRAYDGDMLYDMALDMGLWITHHHTEILGARMFSRVYPELQPSYTLHKDKFEGLWREAARRRAGRRVVWTIGFRGQGDRAFWADDAAYDTDQKRGAFISRVMRRQMEIVREYDPRAVFTTNLYGEMMALYRRGDLAVPEGVIKVWGDNGYGKMVSRRQNNHNPRSDAMPAADDPGPHGIYYHVSFYDLQAANHITMLQTPPGLILEELKTVLARGGGEYWNINVGSVKPHLFMMALLRRLWTAGDCDPENAARDFAARYYGGAEHGALLTRYAECAVSYGPNPDDRAGDQYYHFPLRALARALLRGESGPVESLLWAAGNQSLADQAQRLAEIVQPGISAWKSYVHACRAAALDAEEPDAQRIRDTLELQGLIHYAGCEGLYSFGQACVHALAGNDLQAYLWTDRSLQAHRRALEAMEGVSGRFAGIYQNDCFVGVALTCRVLEGVRAWLRIRGDGELQYDWEKRYLVPPEETRVMLQTHRTAQLSDDALCLRLRGLVPLEKAF